MPKEMTKNNELTRRCGECGQTMVGHIGNYHYTECGLQTVTLKNVLVFNCKCGAIVARIPAPAVLHRAITMSLIFKDSLLVGEEVRFLRKMAGLSGVELANALGIHKATLSKWETDKKRISKNSDGSLRLICFVGVVQNLIQQKDMLPKLAEEIRKLSEVKINKMLREIREVLVGPKDIRINPEELSLCGEERQITPLAEVVQ